MTKTDFWSTRTSLCISKHFWAHISGGTCEYGPAVLPGNYLAHVVGGSTPAVSRTPADPKQVWKKDRYEQEAPDPASLGPSPLSHTLAWQEDICLLTWHFVPESLPC